MNSSASKHMLPIACECNCGDKPSLTQSCPHRRIMPVECAVMNYAWGTVGSESLVARLASVGKLQRTDESLPFAEMWIGTHPSGPSFVGTQQYRMVEMSAWMERRYYQESTLYRKHQLPYLFKVLSVRTALSIQAHPDKQNARRLHQLDPAHYKDDNHKPELACAISEFEALCSFKPAKELLSCVKACPELHDLIGGHPAVSAFETAVTADPEGKDGARRALHRLYLTLMHASETQVDAALSKLITRLQLGCGSPMEALALRLHKQYPGDVGVFCAFLLNHVTLSPGQSLFMAANEPHAYLRGDCIECMACSDNVVRAGLTPKFKDVDVLCNMLTYSMGEPHLLEALTEKDCDGHVYRPPVPEFQLRRLTLKRGETAVLTKSPSVGTVLCCTGDGIAVDHAKHKYVIRPGFSVIVLPDTEVKFSASSNMLIFCCQEQAGKDRKGSFAFVANLNKCISTTKKPSHLIGTHLLSEKLLSLSSLEDQFRSIERENRMWKFFAVVVLVASVVVGSVLVLRR